MLATFYSMFSKGLFLLVPNPAGALWIGALVAIVVFADTKHLTAPRNRALAALLLVAPMLAYLFGFSEMPGIAPWLFAAIYAATAGMAAWGAWLAFRTKGDGWTPNLDRSQLRALVGVLVVLNAAVVFGRFPDDAGVYSNLAAQRWTETGALAYGDPLLKGPESPGGGAAAAYGPLLYAAHIPAQYLIGPPGNPSALDPMDKSYRWPSPLATQLTCFVFYLVGLASLFTILRRTANENVALGAVALFAGSPYVLGLGGSTFVLTGLAYISHIAPSAITLAAMATIRRPFVSGALLASAAGMMFYPAFLFPLWIGWMLANRGGALRFAGGFVTVGVLTFAIVLWYTPAPEGTSVVRLFLESTLEVQEGTGPKAYGASTFGFWGTHPDLAAFWQRPVAGSFSLLKPTFIAYMTLVIASFFLAWRAKRSIAGLAGLTVMLAAGVQLRKTHATGSYVEWYFPFLLIALMIPASRGTGEQPER